MVEPNRWSSIRIACAIFIFGAITLEGQTPKLGGPKAELQSFTPNDGDMLIKGAPLSVEAKVTLIPSPSESIEFTGRITVKKRQFRPFVTTLTPCTSGSCVNGDEAMIWHTRVPGPKRISIRLRLTGLGKSSGNQFTFSDVTRTYSVKCNPKELWLLRRIRHFLGCCLD